MTEQDHAELRAMAAEWRAEAADEQRVSFLADDLDRWLAAHPPRRTVPTVCACCEEPLPTEAEIDAAWAEDKRALNAELESRAQLACKIGLRPGNDWEQIQARIDAMLSARLASEGWQPIATAPRDGDEDGPADWYDEYGHRFIPAPTHWQPLPAPPAAEEPKP